MVLVLTPSRRAFASSTQFGKGFQGRGADVWGALRTALFTLGAVGCTTGKGQGMAAGGVLEGVYICLACCAKGGDFKPCLTKVELVTGQNFLLDLS